MKKCSRCKNDLPKEMFYADKYSHDGRVCYCKSCYEVKRKSRINPVVEANRVRRWNKSNNYLASKMQRVRFPEKYKARLAVKNAVVLGKLIKPNSCSDCLEILPKNQIHAHHANYSKPLVVDWLCRKCHMKEHFPTSALI